MLCPRLYDQSIQEGVRKHRKGGERQGRERRKREERGLCSSGCWVKNRLEGGGRIRRKETS